MRVMRLVSSLGLAALLVMILLVFTHQTGQAGRAPGFSPETENYLRSYQDSNSFASPQALDAGSVISTFLASGDELIHGLTFYKNYLWGSTRYPVSGMPVPARILKIDPDTLSVLDRVDLATGQTDGEDIIGAGDYIWTVLFTSPAQLIRVDPVSNPLTYTTALTFSGIGYGTSLDYAFGYLWVGLQDHIARVDISDPLNPTYQLYDFSSLATNVSVVVNALSHDASYLWASFYQCDAAVPDPICFTGGTVVKAAPAALTGTYTSTNVNALFPDDITFVGQHLYVASEAIVVSDLFQFAGDVSTFTATQVYTDSSYGTFSNPLDSTSVWSVFVSDPGVIYRFSLDAQKQFTLTLPASFADPAEMAFDPSGNIYVSTWQIPPGLIKYTVPDPVVLSISHIGTDVELSWPNSVTDAKIYQVWRSTQPYFNPGDVGASLIAELTPPFTSIVTYTDPAAVGNSSVNYYYGVVAQNQLNQVSALSNRVGEFDFDLTPGTTGRAYLNAISLPLNVIAEIPDAEALANYLGASVQQVLSWDPLAGAYDYWLPGTNVGTNFSLALGHVYWLFLDETAPGLISFSGAVPDPGDYNQALSGNVTDCVENEFSLPIDAATQTAQGISSALSNPEQVLNWNSDVQAYEFWLPDHNFGTNFSLRAGYPYRACLSTNVSWP